MLGALLGEDCRATITIPQSPLRAHCGGPPINARADQQCVLCLSGRGPAHLTSLRAATVYGDAIRGAQRLAAPLGQMLAATERREGLTADLVTLAPAFALQWRQGGCDQSRLLAREAARRLGLPCLPDVVARMRATELQTHLRGNQRFLNVAQAFANVAQAFALATAGMVERIKDRRGRSCRGAPPRDRRPCIEPPKHQRLLVSGRSLPRPR
jgi:hypothetical protein